MNVCVCVCVCVCVFPAFLCTHVHMCTLLSVSLCTYVRVCLANLCECSGVRCFMSCVCVCACVCECYFLIAVTSLERLVPKFSSLLLDKQKKREKNSWQLDLGSSFSHLRVSAQMAKLSTHFQFQIRQSRGRSTAWSNRRSQCSDL